MKTRAWGVVLLALVLPVLAGAQTSHIEVTNRAFQEVEVKNAQGTKQLRQVPADKVLPGTNVTYVTTVKNVGTKPAERVVVDDPLPAHMLYGGVSQANAAGAVEVSVDGGQHFGVLTVLQVVDAQGRRRAADAADVTHVRLTMDRPLQPGDSRQFAFRAVLR